MATSASECDSVAKIYRKATSGVRPQSLDKIKDPDVRAFIEWSPAKPRVRPSASDRSWPTASSSASMMTTTPTPLSRFNHLRLSATLGQAHPRSPPTSFAGRLHDGAY
ncbi:probable serine/threonine-protein kinase WNK7 [Zingiber officinale]|uniref:probable serine/threonine-protein kinase WNK7 n=1 Tax=Zingiber officinale TaxID=94328 RepID=UPI001C4C7F1E|nr:probable serine/threonine-protein kinase WNK7 [Zingiber officinale]